MHLPEKIRKKIMHTSADRMPILLASRSSLALAAMKYVFCHFIPLMMQPVLALQAVWTKVAVTGCQKVRHDIKS